MSKSDEIKMGDIKFTRYKDGLAVIPHKEETTRSVIYWRTQQGDIRTLLKERALLDRLSYWNSNKFRG